MFCWQGIQCLQKAYRCSTTSSSWEKSEEVCKKNTEILLELADAYKQVGSKKHLGTARLQLKSHISRLKKGHTDPVTQVVTSQLINELLDSLNDVLVNLPTPTE